MILRDKYPKEVDMNKIKKSIEKKNATPVKPVTSTWFVIATVENNDLEFFTIIDNRDDSSKKELKTKFILTKDINFADTFKNVGQISSFMKNADTMIKFKEQLKMDLDKFFIIKVSLENMGTLPDNMEL